MTLPAYVGFVNAGFFRAEGARAQDQKPRNLRINSQAVIHWFQELAYEREARFLRTYWYDARFERGHVLEEGQRRFFTALTQTPGIQLRLGTIVEHRPWFEPGIREALNRTASALQIEPQDLMDEFDRQWTFRPERRQRGVDVLMCADLIRLACRQAFDTALLCSGDRDLFEAARTAQEYGVRVVIATPDRQSISRELNRLADEIIEFDQDDLRLMLPPRLPHPD